MSRRWYRHEAHVVFLGWEPAEQGFYVNIVDLCEECAGTGEQFGSEEVCAGCGGEGVQIAKLNPSNRRANQTLDQIAGLLEEEGIPFPYFVRADLEEDQRTNAGVVFHEYDLEIDL
jgi:hypothetical protein